MHSRFVFIYAMVNKIRSIYVVIRNNEQVAEALCHEHQQHTKATMRLSNMQQR